MHFLDVLPHTLFRTFSTPSRFRNIAALQRVFEQFFDDYHAAPRKAELLQIISEVMNDPAYAKTAEDEGDLTGETNEHLLYARLRDDGWFMEVANRRAVEIHMPREAHALLSALMTLTEELSVDIAAEASLIDSGILAAYQDPAGKVMNIVSARRQAIQLRRSIDGVLTSLHRIEDDLMQSDGLADLLTQFMENFVEKLLLRNYRALKTSAYNPMRFQRSIQTNTERFMNDEGQVARAATALADQKLAKDIASAETQILQDLTRIRDVFAGLGEKLDLIDRFSHKLERRIATTVRYQETARNVHEETLRMAIRVAFERLDAGEETCVSPLVGFPVPYSPATLALPKKAREPVKPQKRQRKTIDPADMLRSQLMDRYTTHMSVTRMQVVARLGEFNSSDTFVDLDEFEPQNAQDVSILYEARSGNMPDMSGFEIRPGPSSGSKNRFLSGPSILIRRKELR